MLEPLRHYLSTKKIVLASTSPRRKEILNNIGLNFDIIPSQYEEDLDAAQYKSPSDFVLETAFNKVQEVASRLKTGGIIPDLIIGADTMVAVDNKILGKPANKQIAFDMLNGLSGRPHTVYSGVVLITPLTTIKFFEQTKVYMMLLDPKTIKSYIDTGEPMDKAGGYGIQGVGGTLCEKIDGDYFNVMGLPLHTLCKHIRTLCNENKM